MQRPEGYPVWDLQLDIPEKMSSSLSLVSDMEIRSPFLGRDDLDDLSILERGLYYRRTYSDMGDDHHRIQERANRLGKSSASDPRLLFLLEFFREFYVRRQELLKKIFPKLQNEFIDIFRRVGRVLGEGKSNNNTAAVKTLQRSLSLGSPPTPSNKGGESPLRLERFKIRTVKIGDDDVQEGGQGQTKPSGSK